MRRLVQPGWVLFQLAVVGFWCWIWFVTSDGAPVDWGAPIILGIGSAYTLTLALLILNEGWKDLLQFVRRRRASATEREVAADPRLGSPRNPARLSEPEHRGRRAD